MAKIYIHNVPRKKLRRGIKRFLTLGFCLAVVLLSVDLFVQWYYSRHPDQPASKAQIQVISDNLGTFVSPYFQFQDTGKWVLSKSDSTDSKFVYVKYRGVLAQQQLSIYVNQVPIPLYLATTRVLPVRVVNSNSFDVTGVSDPCGKTYAAGELPKIKEVTINQATMLCDPDDTNYTVVLAQIDGDYQISMRRPAGQSIQYVILYKDSSVDTKPDPLLQIAKTFKTL